MKEFPTEMLEQIALAAEEITPWMASKIISAAIKEHTRATIAFEIFRDAKVSITYQEVFKMTDKFLAAGKKPTTPTENDQAA